MQHHRVWLIYLGGHWLKLKGWLPIGYGSVSPTFHSVDTPNDSWGQCELCKWGSAFANMTGGSTIKNPVSVGWGVSEGYSHIWCVWMPSGDWFSFFIAFQLCYHTICLFSFLILFLIFSSISAPLLFLFLMWAFPLNSIPLWPTVTYPMPLFIAICTGRISAFLFVSPRIPRKWLVG